MGDRLPIGPFPGPVQGLVNADLLLGTLGRSGRVARLYLARQGHQVGDVAAGSIRTATGGGGAGLAFAFAAGAETALADGELDVAAAESLFLRVTSSDANSQDLRGWLELEGPAGLT